MAVIASMIVGQTDRGDTMFMAMAHRSAAMAIDLDALEPARHRLKPRHNGARLDALHSPSGVTQVSVRRFIRVPNVSKVVRLVSKYPSVRRYNR